MSSVRWKNTLETIRVQEGTRMAQNLRRLTQIVIFLKNISSVGQKNTLQTIIDPEGTRMAQNLRGLTQIVKKLKN